MTVYKEHSNYKENKQEKQNMTKIWEINKSWNTPEVSISVDGEEDGAIPLTEIVKAWKNLSEMVAALAINISEGFFVYVNNKEVEQEAAKDIQLSSIRKLVISTEKVPKAKTLREKMKEDDVEEKDIPMIPIDKNPTVKTHTHKGIVGSHRKTDVHRNPVAKKMHDKMMNSEE